MSASSRLKELGIVVPEVATPAGSYVPAIRQGDVIFTSGQLPLVDGALLYPGIVGAGTTPEQAADAARAATLNALAAAAQAAGGIDSIARVVRLVGYVASTPEFGGQPAIMNAGSNLLVDVFGEQGRHVRSAVGVASLPLGACVEVELVVAVRS